MPAERVAVKHLGAKGFCKGNNGAVKGDNAILGVPRFDTALEILFFQIDLNGLVGGNAEAAVDHHQHDPGGGVLLVLPELVDILPGEGLALLDIILLADRNKLCVIFFNDVVLHSELVHLAVQLFDVGEARVTERALVQRLLHVMLADGTEIHLMQGGDVFVCGGIIYAAAVRELFFALHKLGVIESLIDIGEGGGGDAVGVGIPVVIRQRLEGGIPVLVVTYRACAPRQQGDISRLRGGVSGIRVFAVAAQFFDAAEAIW